MFTYGITNISFYKHWALVRNDRLNMDSSLYKSCWQKMWQRFDWKIQKKFFFILRNQQIEQVIKATAFSSAHLKDDLTRLTKTIRFNVSIFAGNADGMQFKNCPLKYLIIVFDFNLFFEFKGTSMLRNNLNSKLKSHFATKLDCFRSTRKWYLSRNFPQNLFSFFPVINFRAYYTGSLNLE